MAVKVRVKNFQSLKDVSLVIDGLTVVTGTNNAGKSALFRAIHGVFANTRGHSFVRHGATHASVEVEFEDAGKVLWEKGKGVNKYTVWDALGGEEVFDKVLHGAPEEVEAFGVRAIAAGRDNHWPQIARQISDVVFLFNQSGATMAEAVADVDRVGLLTKALTLSERDARQAKSELKIRKKDQKAAKKRLGVFEGVSDLDQRVAALELAHQEVQRLETSVRSCRQVAAQMRTLSSFLGATSGLPQIEVAASSLPLGEVVALDSRARELRQIAHRRETHLRAARSLDLGALPERSQRLSEILGEVDALRQRSDALRALSGRLGDIRGSILREDRQLNRLREEVEEVHLELQALIDAEQPCQMCGRPLDGVAKEYLS